MVGAGVGFSAIVNSISGLFNSIFGGIDSISTSDEERLQLKARLSELQVKLTGEVLRLEIASLDAQSAILKAEMQYGNVLTRSWRPVTMLCFMGFVVWFGIGTAFGIPVPSEVFMNQAMGLINIGLGGYVLGRSGEKIAVNVVGAMKKKEGI